ncbi:PREDICTED: protein EMSY-LIKE 3-like [Nelumbo nucifera]|uniref:Protein EMSY-LIKE 3-like n=2 Tax=Nelumbo nucifera TaxID=4432 RepID=A0A1U8AU77_NELNU|nr:PREDICTED: protein EMSY-LIKE 3-like [Nelumbo nucifera]XP_010266720.1 PREDICTED: protein EMSY-LIKE 3-like [Nelumbo nucifera]DAD29143.1 TPA_asm: hypothetical protein HUJ06_030611 [Nelumbo nucifera]
MDYIKHDSSGTDEDTPPQNINRNTWRTHFSANVKIPSATVSCGMDATDMKLQIHCIETEAYSAILKAFIAQSDVLSWGKEGLMTELRKELNVSDLEHRELLVKVDSDDSVRMIREWRKGTAADQRLLSNKMNPPGSVPNAVGHASQKRLKTSHSAVSSSPNYISHTQSSAAAIHSSSTKHFRDGQRDGEMASFSAQVNAGQLMKSVGHNRLVPGMGKGRAPVFQSKKGFPPPGVDNVKKRSDIIEIRATDKLIREVERVIYGGEESDPVQVEKAKLILREHERAIVEALDKLADVSDDDSPDQPRQRYIHKEMKRNGHGMSHHAIYGQGNRLNASYYGEGFGQERTDRAGIPCVDLQEGTPTP